MYGNSWIQGMHDVDHIFRSTRDDILFSLILLNNSGTVTTLTLNKSLTHLIEIRINTKIMMFFMIQY